jgi:hypothetical protein
MPTTKARPKPKPKPKGSAPAAAPLPPGCDALLSRAQVRFALGGISERKLDGMLSAGEMPPPDDHIGNRPRWHVATFNAWLAARRGKGAS